MHGYSCGVVVLSSRSQPRAVTISVTHQVLVLGTNRGSITCAYDHKKGQRTDHTHLCGPCVSCLNVFESDVVIY